MDDIIHFKKVFIKDTSDLPRKGILFIHRTDFDEVCEIDVEQLARQFWLDYIDWYLEPIEPITDADIEAWARKKTKEFYDDNRIITVPEMLIEGAKAALNGGIKHIEKW
jgi:hypothetical protein